MKRVLFLQNDASRYSASRLETRFQAAGLEVDYYWAAAGEFPEAVENYSGALIYASPHGAYEPLAWIVREQVVLRELASRRIPCLGICFGSQILASALCGGDQVFVRPQCEVGYLNVDLSPAAAEDPLLRGLDRQAAMFIWHNDEVRAGHPDLRILGSTPSCPNQIWRYQDLPIWGVQGHPELTREQALRFFEQNAEKLTRDGADLEDLRRQATDTPEAKRIVENFIGICSIAGEAPACASPTYSRSL